MTQALRIHAHENAISSLAPIATLAGTVLTISILSGFHSSPVPYELAWQFSPIGFLESAIHGGLPTEYLELPTANYFRGPSGWSLDYAIVFLKTCILEAPFYYWCFRRQDLLQTLQVLLTANFLTHPAVFFIFPLLFSRYVNAALSAEVFAASVEMAFVWILIAKTRSGREGFAAALMILAANLFSWEVGMFV